MSQPVATNPLTYNGFVTQLGVMTVENTTTVSGVVQGVDAPFNALIPQALNYAELRISRDVDLLPSLTNNNYSLAAGNNVLQISTNDFVTIQTIQVGTGNPPLLPVSKEYLQTVWGSNAVIGTPKAFAMIGGDLTTAGNTYNNIMVGPYPDTTYAVSIYGTIRMPSLYLNATQALANTATTFISQWLPDLLMQAAMIYVSQFQRNFSPTSNDPQMPGSYESQYQTLLKGAIVEEARKRFTASAWSSMSPATVATPTRGA